MRIGNLLNRPLLVLGGLLLADAVLLLLVLQKFAAEIGLALGIAILVGIGVISRLPQRMADMSIGFEMCTFITIVVAITHGFLLAGMVGALSMGISGYLTKERPDDVAIAMLGLLFLAGLASNFGLFTGVVAAGVVYTLVYDGVICGVYLFTGHSPFGCAKFAVTHLVWNFVIFRAFGELVLAVL